MRKLIVLPLLLFAACATQMTSDVQPGAEATIRSGAKAWQDAANRGDVAAMMSIYAEDAVLMPPNAPQLRGRTAIQQFWSGMAGAHPQIAINPTTVWDSCDLATEVGTYDLHIGTTHDTGKYVITWKRMNGEWKAVADIFNSDLAAAH
jgi:uncharacterized protein (TIGR02246 family)